MSVSVIRKILILSCILTLFASCGKKEYPYAEELFDFYEEVIENYEDADNREELDSLRAHARQRLKQIENEQKVSYEELTTDIELLDENAYLTHLRILMEESHAQWMYLKMKKTFEKEDKD